jgi:hypothetical protein
MESHNNEGQYIVYIGIYILPYIVAWWWHA